MQAELATRRRVLLLVYRRYLEADRALTLALRETQSWFPATNRPYRWTIGAPGSRIRRLHEQRARALAQLEAARLKLETAKARLAVRRRTGAVLCLPLWRGD